MPRSRWLTTQDCKMPSSPDTHHVQLAIFADVMKLTNNTGLCDAKLAWYSLSATRQICLSREDDEPHRTDTLRIPLTGFTAVLKLMNHGEMLSSPDTPCDTLWLETWPRNPRFFFCCFGLGSVARFLHHPKRNFCNQLHLYLRPSKYVWLLLRQYGQVRIKKISFRIYTTLYVHLCRFQMTHRVKQCTTCQHTNYHDNTNNNSGLNFFDHVTYVSYTCKGWTIAKIFDWSWNSLSGLRYKSIDIICYSSLYIFTF